MKRHINTMVYLGMQPWPNLPCNQEMIVGMVLGSWKWVGVEGVGIMEVGWCGWGQIMEVGWCGWGQDHGTGLVWMGSGSWNWVGVDGVRIMEMGWCGGSWNHGSGLVWRGWFMEMGWCGWGQDHGNGLVWRGSGSWNRVGVEGDKDLNTEGRGGGGEEGVTELRDGGNRDLKTEGWQAQG